MKIESLHLGHGETLTKIESLHYANEIARLSEVQRIKDKEHLEQLKTIEKEHDEELRRIQNFSWT